MKTAVYPGSFDPWHDAHRHILVKALRVFDKVYVARGINGNKPTSEYPLPDLSEFGERVVVLTFDGLLADETKKLGVSAVIRGLRNVFDFYEEKDNQYWHEDLGLEVPIFYIISDRNLSHISSKAVKIVERFKK